MESHIPIAHLSDMFLTNTVSLLSREHGTMQTLMPSANQKSNKKRVILHVSLTWLKQVTDASLG